MQICPVSHIYLLLFLKHWTSNVLMSFYVCLFYHPHLNYEHIKGRDLWLFFLISIQLFPL